jgi:hypothetical protein
MGGSPSPPDSSQAARPAASPLRAIRLSPVRRRGPGAAAGSQGVISSHFESFPVTSGPKPSRSGPRDARNRLNSLDRGPDFAHRDPRRRRPAALGADAPPRAASGAARRQARAQPRIRRDDQHGPPSPARSEREIQYYRSRKLSSEKRNKIRLCALITARRNRDFLQGGWLRRSRHFHQVSRPGRGLTEYPNCSSA